MHNNFILAKGKTERNGYKLPTEISNNLFKTGFVTTDNFRQTGIHPPLLLVWILWSLFLPMLDLIVEHDFLHGKHS